MVIGFQENWDIQVTFISSNGSSSLKNFWLLNQLWVEVRSCVCCVWCVLIQQTQVQRIITGTGSRLFPLWNPCLILGNDRAKQCVSLEMKAGGVTTAVCCHGNLGSCHINPR